MAEKLADFARFCNAICGEHVGKNHLVVTNDQGVVAFDGLVESVGVKDLSDGRLFGARVTFSVLTDGVPTKD